MAINKETMQKFLNRIVIVKYDFLRNGSVRDDEMNTETGRVKFIGENLLILKPLKKGRKRIVIHFSDIQRVREI